MASRAMRGEPVCPALRILLTFASRSGSSSGAIVRWLFFGSLAFHRARRRLVRRGSSRGKTYSYPEGHPQRFTAPKRVSPFGPVLRRRRCFGRMHLMCPPAGAVSPGEEWSRPKLGRRPARVGVGEFTVPPELADTQPHPKSALAQAKAVSGLARW